MEVAPNQPADRAAILVCRASTALQAARQLNCNVIPNNIPDTTMRNQANDTTRLSDGIEHMPRRMTQREKAADTLYLYMQLSSRVLFIVTALVAYFFHGWYAALIGAALGYLVGIWVRHSMGIRGPNPEEGWMRRRRERAEGSRRGLLEWLIEKTRANEFTREKCRAICKTYDEAVAAMRHCSSHSDRDAILKKLDQEIKSISYS